MLLNDGRVVLPNCYSNWPTAAALRLLNIHETVSERERDRETALGQADIKSETAKWKKKSKVAELNRCGRVLSSSFSSSQSGEDGVARI